MACGFFIPIGDAQKTSLVEEPAHDLQTHWETAVSETHRDVDTRHPRVWRDLLTIISVRALQVSYEPWGVAPSRVHNGVYGGIVHGL